MFGPRRGLAIEQQVAIGKASERIGLVIERRVRLQAFHDGLDADLDADPERIDDCLARGSPKLSELRLV